MHRMRELVDSPALATALSARPNEVWVLRPDAHIAAVLTNLADVAPAVHRLIGSSLPAPVPSSI